MQNLTAQLETLLAETNIPGLAIAVIEEGVLAYSAAFGQYQDALLTPETPFEVASLSKPVFAYLMLKLAQEGLFDLDTPLSAYLPEPYLQDEPLLPLITARHCLSHTSGFPNWRDAQGLRTLFRPGSAFHYSTEGMIYLQTVAEYLLQQPLAEYIQTHLLTPLGMMNSQYLPFDVSALPPFLPRHLVSVGAINLQTTVTDYARFVMAMLHEAPPEMLKPQIQVGDQVGLYWGLGWGLQSPDASFWHWGARLAQTRNFALGRPNHRSGVVIFTTHADGLTLCEPILQRVLSESVEYPALKWLVPAHQWRADGKKILA